MDAGVMLVAGMPVEMLLAWRLVEQKLVVRMLMTYLSWLLVVGSLACMRVLITAATAELPALPLCWPLAPDFATDFLAGTTGCHQSSPSSHSWLSADLGWHDLVMTSAAGHAGLV